MKSDSNEIFGRVKGRRTLFLLFLLSVARAPPKRPAASRGRPAAAPARRVQWVRPRRRARPAVRRPCTASWRRCR